MNPALYQQLRPMNDAERRAVLIARGMTDDQADDFLRAFNSSRKAVAKHLDKTPFSQSQPFADIKARMAVLQQRARQ